MGFLSSAGNKEWAEGLGLQARNSLAQIKPRYLRARYLSAWDQVIQDLTLLAAHSSELSFKWFDSSNVAVHSIGKNVYPGE